MNKITELWIEYDKKREQLVSEVIETFKRCFRENKKSGDENK